MVLKMKIRLMVSFLL